MRRTMIVIGALVATATAQTGSEQGPAEAPPATTKTTIEEIIVTAQKVEQRLQDVPISMSVLDGDFLERQTVRDFRDVALHVPNFSVLDNGLIVDARVRGFGTSLANKGFEPVVGMVVDGIPYARQPYFQTGLLDLQRIEVLRGPQGTLFGKNTTAGLLNVTTSPPSEEEFEGFVDVELGELDRRTFQAAVGGPIVAGLVTLRISGLDEHRDGYVRNTTARFVAGASDRLGGRERRAIRAKAGFPDLFGSKLVLSWERWDIDLGDRAMEPRVIPEKQRDFFREFDPDFDLAPGNFVGSIDRAAVSTRDIQTVVANWSRGLGIFDLHLVAGHSILEAFDDFDGDITPAPMVRITTLDDNPQTTAELRAATAGLPGILGLERLFGRALGATDLTAGVFFQRQKIDDSEFRIEFNDPVLVAFLAAQNAQPGPVVLPIGAIPLGGLDAIDPSVASEFTNGLFEQTSTTIAGFGEMAWRLPEGWTLQTGMRLSHEKKNAAWERVNSDPAPFSTASGATEFTQRLDRSEVQFAPRVALSYDWTDEVGLFASWTRGFRGGGFNESSFGPDPGLLEYDPETIHSWELGTKLRLMDGRAAINLGVFRMDLDEFQVFTLLPGSQTPVPAVVNAAKSRSQGVELDVTWLATSWLTFRGAVGFDDAEYLEFPIGTCAPDRTNTDGDDDPRCDLSGEPLFNTPKWTATAAPVATLPLSRLPLGIAGEAIELIAATAVEWEDVQYAENFVDSRTRQPSYFRVGAHIGLEDASRGWSLRFVGENLTDQVVALRVNQVTAGAGGFLQGVEPPRLFSGSFRWTF